MDRHLNFAAENILISRQLIMGQRLKAKLNHWAPKTALFGARAVDNKHIIQLRAGSNALHVQGPVSTKCLSAANMAKL